MRYRRRKSSPFKRTVLWLVCLALVGWGVYQADLFRRALPQAEPEGVESTTTPDLAVGSATVTAEGAQGGEPWATQGAPGEGSLPATPIWGVETAEPAEAQNAIIDTPTYPTFDAALSGEALFAQGTQLLDAGQIVAGRFALNAALARTTGEGSEARAQQIREILTALNTQVFLGSAVLPDDPAARMIDIQADDTFLKIGRAYGLPAAFLQVLNPSLNPKNLKPQTGIKIVQGPFHASLSKHDNRLDLFARDQYVMSLHVALPEGNYLPRGEYQIAAGTKLQLGTLLVPRMWIGFQGMDAAAEQVTSGWIFGSAGPRGNTTRDRATGIQVSDGDLRILFGTLTETRSHLRVEP